MRNSKYKTGILLLVTWLSLPSAWSDTSPSPSPSVLSDDYDTVCKGVTQGSQKAAYCGAAKDAQLSAKTNDMLWKIYAGVAGICTPMCVLSFTDWALPGWSSYVCAGASVGAGVYDAVETKNYTSAAMSVGSAAMGLAFNQGFMGDSLAGLKTPDAAAKAATQTTNTGNVSQASNTTNEVSHGVSDAKDASASTSQASDAAQTASNKAAGKAACLTAAFAGFNVYQKIQAKQQAEQTEKQNLEAAQQLASSSSGTSIAPPNFDAPPNPPGSGNTPPAGGTSTQLAAGGGNANATTTNPCNGANSTGAAISCASSADSNLAKQLSAPGFDKAFQASSGIPFGDFLQKAGNMSPAGAMGAAMGAAMSPSGLGTMTGALADMQKGMPDFNGDPTGTYVGGGGGAHGGSGDDVASVVGGIMSQFGKKSDKTGDPVSEVKFSGPANRTLASSTTAEDTSVSLFDRVTRRYWNVTPRMTFDGRTLRDWAAAQQTSAPAQTAHQ